jgi:flagellar hook-associated protein 2
MSQIGTFSGIASGIQWRDMVDQIMALEAARRLGPIQSQMITQQNRTAAWGTFNGLLSNLRGSVATLRDGTSFGSVKATVNSGSGTAGFTVTTSSAASSGNHTVEVVKLAQAEKINSAVQETTSQPLGLEGDFWVGGRRIELTEGDTLTSVRDRINASNAGANPSRVTATILTTGPGESRLVLTADNTGTRGIELVDGESGVLQSLGVLDGALAQNANPDDAGQRQSQRFSNTTTTLGSLLGLTAPPAEATIDVGGVKVAVNLETDTLLTLMNKIAAEGGTAKITDEVVGGQAMRRLTVDGAVTADADLIGDPAAHAASQRIVELLGFQVGGQANVISAGENSHVRIDGFNVTRRTNVVSDVLAGVTLNLQQEAPVSQLSLGRDNDAVVDQVKSVVNAYNEIAKFVEAQRQPGQPLATNSSLRATMSSLTGVLLNGVAGLQPSNSLTHASLVGVELTKEGQLKLNEDALRNALQTSHGEVKTIFSRVGTPTQADVTWILSTSKTQPGNYGIQIDAAATRATATGTPWSNGYEASDLTSDTLSILDSTTGKTVEYVVEHDKSLEDAVSELNSLFDAQKARLTASVEGGALRLRSTDYGAGATFTLSGSAVDQLGMAEGQHAGTDVSGTIGGQAATGKGQTLTANDGPATGLSIMYTGSSAGPAGEIFFSLGVGGMIERIVEPIVRNGDGIIPTQISSLEQSIESLTKRADGIEARLNIRRDSMVNQFTRMEGALSLLQSQSNWLTSQIQALQPPLPRNR